MPSPSTVFVVDDDEQVRESLAALIQSAGFEPRCFASGVEFLERYVPNGPACLVLDLRLPQMSGLDVIETLAVRNMRLPVIMISGHGDIPAAVAAMKSGAIDFLEKPYRGAALLESIRRAVELDARTRQSDEKRRDLVSRYETLTADEKQVLELTAAGKPDKAIALKLDLSLRTIQLRRASLMRKLEAHGRAELIRLAHTLSQEAAAT